MHSKQYQCKIKKIMDGNTLFSINITIDDNLYTHINTVLQQSVEKN